MEKNQLISVKKCDFCSKKVNYVYLCGCKSCSRCFQVSIIMMDQDGPCPNHQGSNEIFDIEAVRRMSQLKEEQTDLVVSFLLGYAKGLKKEREAREKNQKNQEKVKILRLFLVSLFKNDVKGLTKIIKKKLFTEPSLADIGLEIRSMILEIDKGKISEKVKIEKPPNLVNWNSPNFEDLEEPDSDVDIYNPFIESERSRTENNLSLILEEKESNKENSQFFDLLEGLEHHRQNFDRSIDTDYIYNSQNSDQISISEQEESEDIKKSEKVNILDESKRGDIKLSKSLFKRLNHLKEILISQSSNPSKKKKNSLNSSQENEQILSSMINQKKKHRFPSQDHTSIFSKLREPKICRPPFTSININHFKA